MKFPRYRKENNTQYNVAFLSLSLSFSKKFFFQFLSYKEQNIKKKKISPQGKRIRFETRIKIYIYTPHRWA